jgi:predicted RNA binding protein YcfA (HicA-like mRNA interferase family)
MTIPTNSKDIIRRLEAESWVLVSSRGSHHKFRKGGRSLIVPHPKKDLPTGTARSIARAAGWLKETP